MKNMKRAIRWVDTHTLWAFNAHHRAARNVLN
jgi:hypothetical protein